MRRKKSGWILVPLGLALVVFSVAADALGFGSGDYVFGWEQKAGVAVGTTVVWLTSVHMLGWRPSREGRRLRRQGEAKPRPTPARASV